MKFQITRKTKNIFYLFSFISLMFVGCSKDDDDEKMVVIPNQEEVITTLRYVLTPDSGGDEVTLLFIDLDGDGGNAPVITVDSLDANTSYSGAITLLNESETPAENITTEVEEEDDEHQFFYDLPDGSGTTISYDDSDADGNPLGLKTKVVTGSSATQVKVALRHEPDKNASGVSDGDITNAGGETDIEVTFDILVK